MSQAWHSTRASPTRRFCCICLDALLYIFRDLVDRKARRRLAWRIFHEGLKELCCVYITQVVTIIDAFACTLQDEQRATSFAHLEFRSLKWLRKEWSCMSASTATPLWAGRFMGYALGDIGAGQILLFPRRAKALSI
jgi:hypothetical protein